MSVVRWSLCLLVLLLAPATASAATFAVNDTTDAVDATPGDGTCAVSGSVCTLRAAVQEANALPGADVVVLPPGPFSLNVPGAGEDAAATGDLDVTDDLTITGAGAGVTSLGTTLLDDRVLEVLAGATVAVADVRVENGRGLDGGGIRNAGALTLTRTRVVGNTTAGRGGGIYNAAGTLTVEASEVSGNQATEDAGAIREDGGTTTIANSTISDNTSTAGADVSADGSVVTIANSLIAAGPGPGGLAFAGQAPQVTSSILAGSCTGPGGSEVDSAGYNVATDATCLGAVPAGVGDVVGDPQLGALAIDAGATQTRALGPGSVALDRGSPTCPATDQRGIARPQGPACDAGPYERLVLSPPVVDPTPTPSPSPTATPSATPAPTPGPAPVSRVDPPAYRETVTASAARGVVLVRLPGTTRFVPLEELTSIPIGSVVDVRRGRVRITAETAQGTRQTAVFYAGRFKLSQRRAYVLLRLVGDELRGCRKVRPNRLATASAKKRKRKLWGSGKGKWRVQGNAGSATVRGTRWLVEDRCTGTLIRVVRGVVAARDDGRGRTVLVRAGGRYFARVRP